MALKKNVRNMFIIGDKYDVTVVSNIV